MTGVLTKLKEFVDDKIIQTKTLIFFFRRIVVKAGNTLHHHFFSFSVHFLYGLCSISHNKPGHFGKRSYKDTAIPNRKYKQDYQYFHYLPTNIEVIQWYNNTPPIF